jgi:hypothetical protein
MDAPDIARDNAAARCRRRRDLAGAGQSAAKPALQPLAARLKVRHARRVNSAPDVRMDAVTFRLGTAWSAAMLIRPTRGSCWISVQHGLPEYDISMAELSEALVVATRRCCPELFATRRP